CGRARTWDPLRGGSTSRRSRPRRLRYAGAPGIPALRPTSSYGYRRIRSPHPHRDGRPSLLPPTSCPWTPRRSRILRLRRSPQTHGPSPAGGSQVRNSMKFDTRCVRAGNRPDPTTGAIVPPIYQTATYTLPEVGTNKGFDYTRSSNPTRAMLEENLAALEGGRHAVCFASGMSAVDAVLRKFNPGDHIVSSDDVYGGVSRLFNRILSRYGL